MKITELTMQEKARLLCGDGPWYTADLGGKLPRVRVADGPCGLRCPEENEGGGAPRPSVGYPAPQCLANSWSREVAGAVGECLADDAKDMGADVLLAPGVNIKRLPLCGRNFEYFSEDPLLTGELAAAYINGLQNNGVAACIKHFFANNSEYNRHECSSEVDERTLREIYLRPFEIAIRKAQPLALMCAYNRINGVRASENGKYFDLLRREFGFTGLIMSDWRAVYDRAASARAGLDLEMPFSETNYNQFLEDCENGFLDEKTLDECAGRVLTFLERVAAIQKPERRRTVEERLRVAEDAAAEGIVLLKNNGVLPLSPEKALSVCGGFAQPDPTYLCGGGSAVVTWLRGAGSLPRILADWSRAHVAYECGIRKDFPEFLQTPHKAVENALLSDVNIVCVGTGSPTEAECYNRASMKLSEPSVALIRETAAANPNTVVLLFAGSAIDVSEWADDVAAIVYAGFCGEGGIRAVAKILTGQANPSGKLSETFPLSAEQSVGYGSYSSLYVTRYEEGLHVGYRYYDSYGCPVAYPFGFGLSYSSFEYDPIETQEEEDGGLTLSYRIRNLSERDGKEISQLYRHAENGFIYRPAKELCAFSKDLIPAGGSKEIKLKLMPEDFTYYAVAHDREEVGEGIYTLFLGASCEDIRQQVRVAVSAEGVKPLR